MTDFRYREAMRDLHVLLVESSELELNRTGLRLLAAGCIVSTCQSAKGLFDAADRLVPDLILLDLVMPGIDLVVLLARCRANTLPPIALHSKVLRSVLGAVVNLKDFLGVVRKSDDDDAFEDAFMLILDELERRKEEARRSLAPAASGTHRIGAAREQPLRPRIVRGA